MDRDTSTARTSAKSTSGPSDGANSAALPPAPPRTRERSGTSIHSWVTTMRFRLSIGWKGHRARQQDFTYSKRSRPINALTSHTSRLAYQPRTLQHAINCNKISMEERMTIKMTRRGLLGTRLWSPGSLQHRCTWPGCQTSGKSRCVQHHRRCGQSSAHPGFHRAVRARKSQDRLSRLRFREHPRRSFRQS